MKHRISHKKYNGHRVYRDYTDPYNPLDLPPYTIRLKFDDGVTPTFSYGTAVQVSSSPNIWDLTYVNKDWTSLLSKVIIQNHLVEVLGANSSNVTEMNSMFVECSSLESVQLFDTSKVHGMQGMFMACSKLSTVPLFNTSNVTMMNHMFAYCTSLTAVPLFDTSKVTNMYQSFKNCTRLTAVPLFDTSKVTDMYESFIGCEYLTSIPLFNTSNVERMDYAFNGCPRVESGALALYQQASTQPNPPTRHYRTFRYCGEYTETGSAELSQIPSDWK